MKRITSPEQIKNAAKCSEFYHYFSEAVLAFAELHCFETDEFILCEGQTPSYLYFVTEGHAKVYLTQSNGKVSLVNFLYAPCFIGEMELLNTQWEAIGVQAMINVTCIALPMRQIRKILLNDPIFLKELCIYLSKKATDNSRTYTRNMSYPLENRLALFIKLTAHGCIYCEKHTEAAEYLAVTYRHLLFVIADFVKKGILQKTSRGYKIVNSDALNQLANPK